LYLLRPLPLEEATERNKKKRILRKMLSSKSIII